MTQLEHFFLSCVLNAITWHIFWKNRFFKLMTQKEWDKAEESADKFLDKLL